MRPTASCNIKMAEIDVGLARFTYTIVFNVLLNYMQIK